MDQDRVMSTDKVFNLLKEKSIDQMSFAIKICTELPENLKVSEFKFLKKTLDFYKIAKEFSEDKVKNTQFIFGCCKDYINL